MHLEFLSPPAAHPLTLSLAPLYDSLHVNMSVYLESDGGERAEAIPSELLGPTTVVCLRVIAYSGDNRKSTEKEHTSLIPVFLVILYKMTIALGTKWT